MQQFRLASHSLLLLFRLLCLLLFLLPVALLVACGVAYQAPVGDITGGPRYVTDGRMHRVNDGETLYSIAWMYDLDYQLLAQVNDIGPPYTIRTGQMLRVDLRGETLQPAVTTTAAVTTPAISSTSIPAEPLPSQEPAQPTVPAPSVPEESTSSSPSPGNSPVEVQPSAGTTSTNTTKEEKPNSSAGTSPWIWPAQGELVGRFSTSGTENKGIDISGESGDPVIAAASGEVVYAGGGLLHYGEMIIIKHDNHHLSAYAHNRKLLVSEGEQVTQGQKIAEMGSTGIDRTLLHFEIREDGRPVDPLGFLPAR